MNLNEKDSLYHREILQRVKMAQLELSDAASAGDHWFRYLMHRYGIGPNDEVNEQGEIIPFIDPNLPVEDGAVEG